MFESLLRPIETTTGISEITSLLGLKFVLLSQSIVSDYANGFQSPDKEVLGVHLTCLPSAVKVNILENLYKKHNFSTAITFVCYNETILDANIVATRSSMHTASGVLIDGQFC